MGDRYGDLLIYVERATLKPEADADEIGAEEMAEGAADVADLP